ncbi:carbohydrate-binding protein [Streptomyces sp. NBC_00378]|uniref:carbohydrate-binding protein n=1 Tax=unclassified Streptomyces TaxID=2593676 RepID=UPI00224CBDA1|nr:MULTISPECIES: carbohydrate-binding protein [unclassified Streptomyces]MCX5110372.1 carbohydrate-binding protein [Streptomyces sp. NBC_00378]
MTAGNNGANKPEDDDPFGYLYEDGQAAGAQPPRQGGYGYPGPAAPQPGVPRTSYNQVRTVGERQYGQQVPQQQAYGQQQGYHQPNAQYAAPETYPGASTAQVPQQGGRGRSGGSSGSGGPNTKGLLIAAVAVVLVVLIGIGAALLTGDPDKDKKKDEPTSSAGPGSQVDESPKPQQSPSSEAPVELPEQDAATLKLGGTAQLDNTVKGAESSNGQYINLNEVGRSATWSVEVPKAGPYTLFVTYGVPGKDAKTSLTVNSEAPRGINMKNYANAPEGDLEKGWTNTFAYVNLNKGANTLMISCNEGDQCDANLDQLSLKAGHVKR